MGLHWYDKDGEPCHYTETKTGINKGKLRDTTLADAKRNNLRPSVTGIIGIMDKGNGLTQWMIREALKKERDSSYVGRDYAKEGSIIHNYIEDWINGEAVSKEGEPYIESAKACFKEYGVKEPIAEATFSTLTYGGSVDCHDTGSNVIIDYKTKDFDEPMDGKRYIYDSHAMQLWAYREGLGMPHDTRLVNVFLSRTSPDLWCAYEHTKEDIERGGRMFELCSSLWYLKNKMEVDNG